MKKNEKSIILLSLVFTVSLVFIGCSKDDDSNSETSGNVIKNFNQENMNFTEKAGEQTFSFTTNTAWAINVAPTQNGETPWCTVAPTSGNAGSHTIKVTTTPNETYDDRSVTVTLKAGTEVRSFVVSQKQKDALLLTNDKFEVDQKGGTVTVEVKANVSYTATIGEECKDWIKESGNTRALSTTAKSYDIAMNEEDGKREGSIIFSDGSLTETVHIYQTGGSIILLSRNDCHVSASGEEITVELRSNCDYEVIMPSVDWIKATMTRGMSSHTLHYTVAANDTYDRREAQIVYRDRLNNSTADTLTILQAQKDAIIVSEKEVKVGSEGGTVEVKIDANVDFEMQLPDVDWISEASTRGLSTHNKYLKIEKNTNETSRTAEIVFKNTANNIRETLTITQLGNGKLSPNISGKIVVSEIEDYITKNECYINTFTDEVRLDNSGFNIHVEKNNYVQSFVVYDKNFNVLLMSRAPIDRNENVELSIESTALALVTMYPLFSPMKSDEYDEVITLIKNSDKFSELQSEVENVVKAKRNLYDDSNEALLNAFDNLIDDLCINIENDQLVNDKGIADFPTRAICESPKVAPFYAEINKNVLTLRNKNLAPSYYGTVTHANGTVDDIAVLSRDDRGALDILKSKDEYDLGPKCNYTFKQDGEYRFNLSRINTAATIDFYSRLTHNLLAALGLDLDKVFIRDAAFAIEFAMAHRGIGVYDPFISPMEYLGIGYSVLLEYLQKKYVSKEVVMSTLKFLSGTWNWYNKIKGIGNAAVRMIYSLTARPLEVNFCLCYYNGTVSSCVECSLLKYGGDKQTGEKWEQLPKPLTVFVSTVSNDGKTGIISPYHKVKFEVVSGGGSVSQELVSPNNENFASTNWTVGEKGEQKVKVTVVNIITNQDASQPVYFTADLDIEEDTYMSVQCPACIVLDEFTLNESPVPPGDSGFDTWRVDYTSSQMGSPRNGVDEAAFTLSFADKNINHTDIIDFKYCYGTSRDNIINPNYHRYSYPNDLTDPNYKFDITFSIEDLEPHQEYTCWIEAKMRQGIYKDSINFSSVTPNTEEFVDMGNGVKWCNSNVGASTPQEYGTYFYNFVIEDYPDYRLPTSEDFKYLATKCRFCWGTYKGVQGALFVAPNGNSIFLPGAGKKGNAFSSDYGIGERCFYKAADCMDNYGDMKSARIDIAWHFFDFGSGISSGGIPVRLIKR